MLLIRQYEPIDQAAVWDLHNIALWKIGVHAGNGPWDNDLHSIKQVYLDNGGEFLVGLLDGRIVAMGAIRKTSIERAEVKRMRVHPDFQGRGFGQQILSALIKQAIELGYKTLHLDTAVIQTAAQQLYLKNGFIEVGRTVLAGFDAILFEKEIG